MMLNMIANQQSAQPVNQPFSTQQHNNDENASAFKHLLLKQADSHEVFNAEDKLPTLGLESMKQMLVDEEETLTGAEVLMHLLEVTQMDLTQVFISTTNSSDQTLEKLNQVELLAEEITVKEHTIDKVNQLIELLSVQSEAIETKEIILLLQKLTDMPKDVVKHTLSSLASPRDEVIVTELLDKYSNKALMAKKGYQTHAKVTSEDVTRWIDKALSNVQENSHQASFGERFMQASGHSIIEQVTMHVETQSTDMQFRDSLIEAFEKVVSKSSFMKFVDGNAQMKIQLNPSQLGHLNINIQEVDGEMLVKILASSEQAKEALEGSLKELRHMFSPHQVIVEKEEPIHTPIATEQQQFYQEQDDEQSPNQQQRDNNDRDEATSLSFEDVLMNERV